MSVFNRYALITLLIGVAGSGALLWWASALLPRLVGGGPALAPLADSAGTASTVGSTPVPLMAFVLMVATIALLIVFLALVPAAVRQRRQAAATSESVDRIAGLLKTQQDLLDTLVTRLDALSIERETRPRTGICRASDEQDETELTSDAMRRPMPRPLPLTRLPHVLRTPLHGILGHAQNLRRDPVTPRQHLDALEAIDSSGRQLLDLLNDLVDLSRLESGETQLADQPLSLRQVVDDSLSDISGYASEHRITLETDCGVSLPWTRGDAARLRRLLIRLIRSTIGSQPMPAEKGRSLRLEIRHANDRLTVSLIGPQRASGFAAVGSPEARGDTLTETELDYLVGSRFVALLGGDVLRDLSNGAFSARLPMTATTPASAEPASQALPGNLHCRLLVVEPRPELQRICVAALADTHCVVETAHDLTSAGRRLQRDPFDLVLLGINGSAKQTEDAAAELRLVAAGDPAVITVGRVGPERQSLAQELSFDAVLDRPIDPGQLVATVGQLLRRPLAKDGPSAAALTQRYWPQPLGRDTAARLQSAADLGDIESLETLCDELSKTPGAPPHDVERLLLAVRQFDLDALRLLADRCTEKVSGNGAGA